MFYNMKIILAGSATDWSPAIGKAPFLTLCGVVWEGLDWHSMTAEYRVGKEPFHAVWWVPTCRLLG